MKEAEETGLRFAILVDLTLTDYDAAETKFQRLNAGPAEREQAVADSIPGMTYPEERNAVLSAARNMSGNGQILDLGCFLGSLTVPMAMGLAKNEKVRGNGVRVHAFDHFVWYADIMDQFWRKDYPGEKPLFNQSFQFLFEHLTARWHGLIDVHAGDLMQEKWSEPIEVLSIDAMKTPTLARHISAEFMPNLIPGAYVFHQDFGFDMTWWIHIYHYLLREHLEVSDPLPGASGVMFRLVSPITKADKHRVLSHDVFNTEIADCAFRHSLDLVAPADRRGIADSHILYYTVQGQIGRADELRATYAAL